jgi:hypothetical protein
MRLKNEPSVRRAQSQDLLSRRSFLLGTGAVVLEAPLPLIDPPLPERRRFLIPVMGDSVAEDLWFGLREAPPPRCLFIQKGKPSTGLTQPSFFDWPAKAQELAQENWGAVIVLMGLNDNLPIRLDKKWTQVGEPTWRATYAERALNVMRPFLDQSVPVIWIGPPCVKSKTMDKGMFIIHQILAEQVPAAGGIFISGRELTLGPDQEYIAGIKDQAGRFRQLRVSDGVHFTSDGNRFLAARVLEVLRATPAVAPIFS